LRLRLRQVRVRADPVQEQRVDLLLVGRRPLHQRAGPGVADRPAADDQLQLVVLAVGIGQLTRCGGGLGLGLVEGGGSAVDRIGPGAGDQQHRDDRRPQDQHRRSDRHRRASAAGENVFFRGRVGVCRGCDRLG
jgi:hypothetical protein